MSDTAHPFLPAATPLLLADDGGLRVGGVESTDGVLIGPAATWLAPVLRGLDGRRPQRAVLADAARAGADPAAVRTVLQGLRSMGLVVDLDAADLLAADAGPAAEARAATEWPTAVLRSGRRSAWERRRAAAVVVEGATRVGTPLAALLAASGVGRVSIRDSGLVGAGDVVVGGLTVTDEGRLRSLAAADAVRRASPLTDLRPLPPGTPPDVVVLARPWDAADPLARGLSRAGLPHLVAAVRGETGVVGPFVVPGVTSCLHCADLHRRDADPSWPRIAVQLTAHQTPASGATLTCVLTAVLAAQQVLAHLDGRARPATAGGTVELRPPDLLPRMRRWPPHPSCGCLPPGAAEPRSDDRDLVPDGAPAASQATMAR